MVTLDQIAKATLERSSLQLRSLVQDYLRENEDLSRAAPPISDNHDIQTTAAALLELLASRRNQPAPAWTHGIGPLAEPFYLVAAAENMTHLRRL